MKTSFKILIAASAACLAFLVAPPELSAAGGTESFNITNRLVAGETTATGNPTNSAGIVTGGAISVDNYTQVGISVEGANTIGGVTNIGNTTSNFVYVALVRSTAASPPTSIKWETTPFWSVKVPVNGTTRVVYLTNLEAWAIAPARWIGVYAASNTCSSGTFTNSADGHLVKVVKKIIPQVFP